MLTVLSEQEVNAINERRAFLYSSGFTIDNITALLMDPERGGGFGLHEEIARAKAHAVIGWLTTITGISIPSHK